MIFAYPEHSVSIQEKLVQGASLVACLCTTRCHKCDDWWADLSALSDEWSAACFVWLDVDENPDMVADIPGLDAYPFMLVRVNVGSVTCMVPQNGAECAAFLRHALMPPAPAPRAGTEEGAACAPQPEPELRLEPELRPELSPEPSLYYFLTE